MCAVCLIKNANFFFKLSKELTLDMVMIKTVDMQNGKHGVNAYHGRDFHPLDDHMTKLRISPKKKIVIFLLQLMLKQA